MNELKSKVWKDESGNEIPIKYISAIQKKQERHSQKLVQEAKKVNKNLVELKRLFSKYSEEIFNEVIESKKDRKGNFTWYNFDRSIKVEINDAEKATYDDLLLKKATEKLTEFIDINVDSKNNFIKPIIIDALRTTNGRVDSRKIATLIKYENKVKDTLYSEAMNTLKDAYRLVKSKVYFRISLLNEEGEYESVDLNFSSIKV